MLDIHEPLRDGVLESGGVILPGVLSELPRPSKAGRFTGVFCAGVGTTGAGDGTEGLSTAVTDFGLWGSWWAPCGGRPPCDDVFGGASRARPGDEGA